MKITALRVLVALASIGVGMSAIPAAHAQMATARVDELVANLVSMAEKKCAENQGNPLAKNLEAQGKLAEAFQVKTSIQTLCVCMPSHARALLKKLPAGAREARVSQDEFTRKYLPQIMNPCAADALKAAYGEGCATQVPEK